METLRAIWILTLGLFISYVPTIVRNQADKNQKRKEKQEQIKEAKAKDTSHDRTIIYTPANPNNK